MPSRRQLNRLQQELRRAGGLGLRRPSTKSSSSAADRGDSAPSRPAPRTPGADIHPLLADEPSLTPAEQEQALLGTLTNLDAPCQEPACGHALGFHTFIATGLPLVCGYAGCGCQNFQEEPVLNPHDPFAGLPSGEPPDPEAMTSTAEIGHALGLLPPNWPADAAGIDVGLEPAQSVVLPFVRTEHNAQNAPPEALSGPQSDADPEPALTPVLFPVLASGARSMPVLELQGPARRVAELVEALEPVLAPPAIVAELARLVDRAKAIAAVTDAASYQECCDVYEQLVANEKGIEGDGTGEDGSIGAVVAFFHRPWKAMCEFRAKFAKPVAEEKKRLSDIGGAWKLAEEKRARDAANEAARVEAENERSRLREIAERAAAKAATMPATEPLKQVLETAAVQAAAAATEVLPVAQPVQSLVPSTPTRGRKKYEAVLVDADAFYKALLEDSTRRVAAPVDMGYLNKQAVDLGEELSKRFPGVEVREKGGLTAGGKR